MESLWNMTLNEIIKYSAELNDSQLMELVGSSEVVRSVLSANPLSNARLNNLQAESHKATVSRQRPSLGQLRTVKSPSPASKAPAPSIFRSMGTARTPTPRNISPVPVLASARPLCVEEASLWGDSAHLVEDVRTLVEWPEDEDVSGGH